MTLSMLISTLIELSFSPKGRGFLHQVRCGARCHRWLRLFILNSELLSIGDVHVASHKFQQNEDLYFVYHLYSKILKSVPPKRSLALSSSSSPSEYEVCKAFQDGSRLSAQPRMGSGNLSIGPERDLEISEPSAGCAHDSNILLIHLDKHIYR